MYGDFTLVVFLFRFLPRLTTNKPRASFLSFFSLYSSKVSGVLWCRFLSEESISNSATHKESSSFTPVVNPQLWQNFAAVSNREPQPEQNIMANSKIHEKLTYLPSPFSRVRAHVFFLFAAFVFCLQRSFFVLQHSFFVCSVCFLFAAFVFCLQRFFYLQHRSFICSSRFLFAAYFFICSVSFLFAAFLFCLQRFFFVCSMSLVGHRTFKPVVFIQVHLTNSPLSNQPASVRCCCFSNLGK